MSDEITLQDRMDAVGWSEGSVDDYRYLVFLWMQEATLEILRLRTEGRIAYAGSQRTDRASRMSADIETQVQTLHLESGDAVVVQVTDPNRSISRQQAEHLVESVRCVLGEDQKVLVMPYGLELQRIDTASSAPNPGDIPAGQYVLMIYDSDGFGYSWLDEDALKNDKRLGFIATFAREQLEDS